MSGWSLSRKTPFTMCVCHTSSAHAVYFSEILGMAEKKTFEWHKAGQVIHCGELSNVDSPDSS